MASTAEASMAVEWGGELRGYKGNGGGGVVTHWQDLGRGEHGVGMNVETSVGQQPWSPDWLQNRLATGRYEVFPIT